jgi:anti-anti-sigma regulatory factor
MRHDDIPAWLTTVLRPAGELDPDAERRLVDTLEAAAAASDVVVVDVGAVGPLSRDLRRALSRVHTRLTARGGALVLLDPSGDHGLTRKDGDLVHRALPASRAIPA